MAEALGVAAGVVSVTVPALHGARLLLDDLKDIRDASPAIEHLWNNLQDLETAFTAIESLDDQQWQALGDTLVERSKATISRCKKECEMNRSTLQRWTKHSDGKLVWRDRFNIGFFQKKSLRAMSEQLQSCKLSLVSVVSVATLYSSIHRTHDADDLRNTMLMRQAEIRSAVTTTDGRLTTLENTVAALHISTTDQADVEAEAEASDAEARAEASRQLQEEREALDASRKLLEELLSKLQETAAEKTTSTTGDSGRPITVTFGTGNSGFQAGTINGAVSGISFGK